ncbi:MAG: SAM-dependent methyltransferase [Candidatus Margulisbacteria bacterium]|nr:SAM-dependent methyltransferase [Candidatus Margulisiibacteriota bacterium]MBU1021510.1 SAM-dependent methyltransferase [Candidatus Margulisiibacteriota bacterium]MBU1728595.1 SAM-dependent methyltransferase [Candidatus Margulisiibacteriota bacterium]MBU1955826.1 SAM-dependent methyltransferase [Candidatus Margulisiibacteriota bacterium]
MEKLEKNNKILSSFRDPSGFLFIRDDLLYRQINLKYKEDYDHLMSSGLYSALVKEGLLIPHEEIIPTEGMDDIAYKIIKPENISFISYPYEWSFSQLKDAALTTLKIQKKAIEFGMSLKDASAYNIQFKKGRPVLIDTLSFEKYKEGEPWVAYKQFCQHFLAPLALMSHKNICLNRLFQLYIDGVPLDLASSLLPFSTRFSLSLFPHIHLHAKSQKHFANKSVNMTRRKISRLAFLGIIDSLESAIKKMRWKPMGTEWADYYNITNYSSTAFQQKKEIVANFLDKIGPTQVWDLGANDGFFSRIASQKGIPTISFDIDPSAVEKNYLECVANGEDSILPLLLDLTNPSPSIGWENSERDSWLKRGPVDAVLALALVHHLAISNNVPLRKIAAFFSRICFSLIIEFVPKTDSQVQKLLSTREDIFPNYTQPAFEREFGKYFTLELSEKVSGSDRVIYLMRKR